jgi:hypothetical protein
MTKHIGIAVMLALGSTLAVAADMPKKTKHSTGTAPSTTQEVRDWAAIDSNKDGYIEPNEMEKYLQAKWAKNQLADKN